MIRKIIALIWLRIQVLMSNKVMLSQVIMPVGMLVLYNSFLNKDGQLSHYMLYSLLTLAFSISSGMMVSSTIAEETEKRIFKTLSLSGVSNGVYLLSVLFFPILLAVANIVIFPKIVDVDFGKQMTAYLVITALTALCVILIYLVLGSLAKTQAQSQVYSTIPTLAISFIPMFSQTSEKVQQVMEYTFLGVYSDFFIKEEFKMTFSELRVSLLWILGLLITALFTLKKSKTS